MIGIYIALAVVGVGLIWLWFTHNAQLRQARESLVDMRNQVKRFESEIASLERSLKQLKQQEAQAQQRNQQAEQRMTQFEQTLNALEEHHQALDEALSETRSQLVQTQTPAVAVPAEQKVNPGPSQQGLQGLIDSPKAQKVFELMERGESQAAIARECELQISEVLLIMGLKKFMGKTAHG